MILTHGDIAAIIGLPRSDFLRARTFLAAHGVSAEYGGCIDDGSNMNQMAKRGVAKATIVLWRPRYSRFQEPGLLQRRPVIRINGVSSIESLFRKTAE